MKIIDAHHHLWDPVQNDHPWLRDEPMIPFRYGDYLPIRKRFMLEDYDALAAGWNIIANVTMEGEWNPADPTGEAIWMQKLADETGRPSAHVAQCWLDREDLDEVLSVILTLPIVKSVRHKPRSSAKPGQGHGGMMDPAFRAGFKKLRDYGLMFDLQTPWWHLDDAIDMAAIAPEIPIILNHTGLPADRSPEGIKGWRAAMAAFARLEQVKVKISGLGLPGAPWRIEDNRDIIRFAIDIFGTDRCMFASNFPVDSLCGSFDTIFSGFDNATSDYSLAERETMFGRTAASTYGIGFQALSAQ
ncbi:MAG: amidohydrolase family protein [Geminicoccaceae bacterium]